MLKTGVISNVIKENGRYTGFVDVLFENEDDKVVTMPVWAYAGKPNVRDRVACIHQPSGLSLCLGRYYYDGFSPDWSD